MPFFSAAVTLSKVKLRTGFKGDLKNGNIIKDDLWGEEEKKSNSCKPSNYMNIKQLMRAEVVKNEFSNKTLKFPVFYLMVKKNTVI